MNTQCSWAHLHILLSKCVCAKLLQLCPTLCDPVDHSLPGSSVYRILQARILEWVAIHFSRGSSRPKDGTLVLLHCRQILYHLSHQGSPLLFIMIVLYMCIQQSLNMCLVLCIF